jgi:organic hydroperoxide reductase OsmC/OhrA
VAEALHRYRATCRWSGSTAAGYHHYDRSHEVTAPPAGDRLTVSADAAFGGDPAALNPESLVLAAAASCQLLSFLAVAARARVEVVAYEDEAEAEMPAELGWLTRIRLRPRITVRAPATEERVHHLSEVAHRECYVARSLRTEITLAPSITVVPAGRG